MDSIPQKQCPHCKNLYPTTLEYFHKHTRNGKVYLSSWCKKCQNELRKKNAKEHPEVRQAYTERNRTRIQRVAREHYAAHPEYQDKQKERSKETYYEDVEYSRLRAREYYQTHVDEFVARNKEWAKNNPERYKIIHANRYSRDKNAEGSYTEQDLDNIYEELEGRCAYCGISIYWTVKRDVHIDHIRPLSKGGTNWPDNITLACKNCNCSKSNKLLDEWIKLRGW